MDNKDLVSKYENTDGIVNGVEKLTEMMAFKNRELYLDDVNRDAADAFNTFIRIWNKLDAESHIPIDEREPIKIYINSDGGDLAAAFSIIDTIKMSKTPVWTINTGCAYSSGLEIFIVGHYRIAYPFSSFLFHEGYTGFGGDANKFKNYSHFYERLLEMSKQNILDHSSLTEEEYEKVKKDDWWFLAQDAYDLGMCDIIAKELY